MHVHIRNIFALLFLLIYGSLSGQITPSESHALALGTSSNPTVLTGVHGLYANPASVLVGPYKFQGTASGLNRYGTDIFTFSGAAAFRVDESSQLGLSLGSYGIPGFKENFATVSFTRRIGSSSYLAVQPLLSRLDIEGLGQRSSWDLTLGYFGQLSSSFTLSAHVEHIRSFMSREDARLGRLNLGIGYELSPIAELYSTITYSSDETVTFRPGLVYKPHEILDLYISVGTSPSTISFGVSLDINQATQVHVGYQSHPDLGSSLGLGLTYSILE